MAVWERDGGMCIRCDSDEDLQFDHIIPFAKGGGINVENIQILCGDCNRAKSDSIVELPLHSHHLAAGAAPLQRAGLLR